MKTGLIAFKIWILTIVLSVFSSAAVMVVQAFDVSVMNAIGGTFVLLVGGTLLGLPFLLLTVLLIRLARRFPYGVSGKLAWFFAVESIFVLLYYAVFSYVVADDFRMKDGYVRLLAGTTIAAFLLSLYINRRGFAKGVGDQADATATPGSTLAMPKPADHQNTTV